MVTMERAYDRVARMAIEASTLPGLWEKASEVISEVVPHYTAPCWYTLDPASLLITSHFNPYMPELPPEALTLEIYDDDVNRLADVARSPEGLSTLHDATGGDPSSSPRWQANMAMGGDQEMIAALRDRGGQVWGALGLYREPGKPMFDAAEKRFVSSVAPLLAEGARRGLLLGEAQDPDRPDAPGLVVVSDQREVESMTAGTAELLADLPDGDLDTGRLPSAVVSVAARTLRCAAPGTVSTELMQSRVLCRSGRWVVLHGAMLGAVGTRRVAVIVEPAQPARIAPLLMAAYGLTEREQEVTRLVLCGYSTTEIADALVLSPHTVQQHLKGVFDKTGVRSRRDLTGQVFFSHYEPRLRDNEARVPTGQALRGGPAPLRL